MVISYHHSVYLALAGFYELEMWLRIWTCYVLSWWSGWWESVQLFLLLNRVHLFVTPWSAACQASLSFIVPWSLLKLMSTELMMPSNHLIHCCPLLLLPSIFPSIRVFSNESALCIRWPKYWSFIQLQHQSFQWMLRIDFLLDGLVWSPCSPRDSLESSPVSSSEMHLFTWWTKLH